MSPCWYKDDDDEGDDDDHEEEDKDNHVCLFQDIPTTLAQLAGGSIEQFSDGFDLMPHLLHGESWPRFDDDEDDTDDETHCPGLFR